MMLMMLVGAVKKSSKSDRYLVQVPGAELLKGGPLANLHSECRIYDPFECSSLWDI